MSSDEKSLTDLSAEQQDWLRYWKEVRAAAEPFEKRAVEYHKAAVEFSKLLVTNLFVLNTGGLVAIPTLTAFLGVGPADRAWTVGPAAAGFGAGLLCAALCALVTYMNYHGFVAGCELERNKAVGQVNSVLKPDFQTREEAVQQQAEIDAEIANAEKKVNRTYLLGHAFGWASVLSFSASAIWLATRLH